MAEVKRDTDPMLHDVVQAIVDEVRPIRIVLFGSRARGDDRPDSDVDLLVIEDEAAMEGASRRRETARIRRALWRFPVPIDLLVFTPREIEKWKGSVNHVIARALREGKVLHERP